MIHCLTHLCVCEKEEIQTGPYPMNILWNEGQLSATLQRWGIVWKKGGNHDSEREAIF